MLSPEQQRAIQSSIEHLTCSTRELSALFYDRLFAQAPEIRALFPDKMAAQVVKLEQTLVYTISMMNDPDELFRTLDELGVAHGDLGARPEHYDAVGAALIDTLRRQVLGWNEEQESSWGLLYHVVSARMQSASAAALRQAAQGPKI